MGTSSLEDMTMHIAREDAKLKEANARRNSKNLGNEYLAPSVPKQQKVDPKLKSKEMEKSAQQFHEGEYKASDIVDKIKSNEHQEWMQYGKNIEKGNENLNANGRLE